MEEGIYRHTGGGRNSILIEYCCALHTRYNMRTGAHRGRGQGPIGRGQAAHRGRGQGPIGGGDRGPENGLKAFHAVIVLPVSFLHQYPSPQTHICLPNK